MATFTQLRDLYSFPGFVADTHVRGLFGDPYAVVIPLRRRSKKPPAASAASSITRSTTKPLATSATSMPEDDASTFTSPFDASTAERVMP